MARILSIPPGLPFLPTLAGGVLDGRIVPGFAAGDDPLALADVTILVPTRRAARALMAAFAAASRTSSSILPRILPLGSAEEPFGADGPTSLLPVVDPLRRRLELARLVRFWKSRLGAETLARLTGTAAAPDASSAEALWLAGDLARLLDEAADEEVPLASLTTLGIEDRLAGWWQVTLTFLEILTRHWPAHLEALGLAEPSEARREADRLFAARLAREGSPGPIVHAGSTATAPSAVALMRAVAELPNGALVLPGLDMDLDGPSFERIRRKAGAAVAGHPQYALSRILAGLGTTRADVEVLAEPAPLAARRAFLSDALRPAETTERWAAGVADAEAALSGIALIEAPDERTEALAIAVAMREALSDPKARVALTTPDRDLARRVVGELTRFGIAANDSAGRPLAQTPPGTLARLALSVAFDGGDRVALLSLLKHPLTRLGLSSGEARRGARAIELLLLRGNAGPVSLNRLAEAFSARREAFENRTERASRAVSLLGPAERDLGHKVAERLSAALGPLRRIRDAGEVGPFARALTESLEALAADEAGGPSVLYDGEAGAALAAFLSDHVAAPAVGFAVPPREWPDVFTALVAEASVRPRAGLSQRAFVWGALEARLQDVDVMILGGLDEGVWPQGARSDAFLSRLMRAEVSLDPPERRTGLAAHDVWMAAGAPRLVLARALRRDGAPAIASRWLQRLTTLAGPDGTRRLLAAGRPYLAHAAALDEAPAVARAPRPAPRPPVDVRPRRYSVTEVEKLFRDPYAVHAKRILRLEPLAPLVEVPGAAERGTLFHAILADFARDIAEPGGEGAEAEFLAIAERRFDAANLPDELRAVWWPRIERLAVDVVAWERGRQPRIRRRNVEVKGRLELPDLGVTLTGEADRVDEMTEGTVEILDFKTGSSPSAKQARTLLAPQLALEAGMARAGAFPGIAATASVAELWYVRLRERGLTEDPLSAPAGRDRPAVTADGLGEEAIARFRGLAARFLDPATGFLSRARPFRAGDFSGDYDHLARAREWALGEDEEDGGEGEAA